MVTYTDAFLHPFDDPLVWQGHATIVDELARADVKPGAVVLSVGGGGLLCGVVEGLCRHGWTDVPVIAVETEGAASYARSVAAGCLVELPAITSIATSLGARSACEQALSWSRHHPVRNAVVSDRASVAACLRFLDDQRTVVEPACGASLSVVYDNLPVLEELDPILVIVCGGATVSVAQLQQWMTTAA